MTFAAFCNRFDKRSNRDAFTGPMKRAHVLLGVAFGAAFIAVTTKMVMCAANAPELPVLAVAWTPPPVRSRPDIVDRKGRLLATDIRAYWLYANPQQLVDADEAAEKISTAFRDLDQGSLAKRFHDKSSRFEWVKQCFSRGLRVGARGKPNINLACVRRQPDGWVGAMQQFTQCAVN